MNTQKQIILIVALLFMAVGGCAAYAAIDLPVRAESQQTWTLDQSRERGALLYANNCRTCHGNRGEGGVGLPLDTPELKNQDPLALAANKAMLRRTLYCGRAGTRMPAWLNTNGGSLNAIQIEHLINLITAPEDTEVNGVPTSKWWLEAEHFAHNLNTELTALVSGDTLTTIAQRHGIGYAEISAANGNRNVDEVLPKYTRVRIPGFSAMPNGYIYTVYKDNETLRKIADAQFVGPVIIADLNGLKYTYEEKRGIATMQLLTADGQPRAGLFPGETLRLPEGATYIIAAGDTPSSIAQQHGIAVADLRRLNPDIFNGVADTAELEHRRRLTLPNLVYVAKEGQTLAEIAELHGITDVAALATLNNLDPASPVVNPGQEIRLPAGTRYIVGLADTWQSVANDHKTTVADLARANNADPATPLSQDVVIRLPNIDRYTVKGQNLEEVAAGFSNVTAATLAEANGIQANSILAIGTALKLPDSAWGTAPPDAINPGTACVQYAIPNAVFETLPGLGTPVSITKPENFSTDVKIDAHASDWTVIADGQQQPPNQGGVKVKPGTTITFTSIVGLHNIVFNGQVQGPDLRQGDTRQITMNTPGEFKVTCDYHPPMLAYIWVEE
ncbi:LysM peptidoglycan-binding domain-containing protein [Tepidiforma flava]|uniref:LysM peptidoglycan-binding domain-containing protein n=1 Tax=Tepidiforma flava TaxID=3004094 RepID=A0ABY7M3W6_9CHLR|nr:LysM peptidoglycan-binding domain-containing protein [Tepidiforma flava]WBL34735.1 LysM peptidoglycan-binding domain-containing protein [Tepidiforma flava]